MEACEFWTAFCESEIDKDALRPFLPRVLPVLLKNMVRCLGLGVVAGGRSVGGISGTLDSERSCRIWRWPDYG